MNTSDLIAIEFDTLSADETYQRWAGGVVPYQQFTPMSNTLKHYNRPIIVPLYLITANIPTKKE